MVLVALTCGPRGALGQDARGVAAALRVATTREDVRVDGHLAESAWSVADSIGGLTQVEPQEGGAPSARTVVRVLFTGDAVVIGVRADDPDPAHIVAFARQRDATLDAEDHVKIVLDTYRDGRSGYVFSVNPNGARYDALVTDQGADIFDFGLGLEEDVIPFFSRRIGLFAGEQVPIDVGVKVNGRAAGTNFGALAVSMRRVDTLTTAAGMGVVRAKQNVLGESSAGFIATVGDPLGRRGSWLVGPDLTYSTSRFHGDKNFLVGVWGLATGRGDLARGDRTAAGFKVDYPSDLWDAALSYKRIGDASRAFGTNTRLRWTYSPLGELFVVYDHNLRTRDPLTLRRELAFASNQLLVKAQYAFRY